MVVISSAEVGNKVSLALKKHTFLSDKSSWNVRRAETLGSGFVYVLSLESGRLDLTFVWMASLDVSGDADNGQGVDAGKAEEQREETIYLEENREREEAMNHDITSLKCLGVITESLGAQIHRLSNCLSFLSVEFVLL